MSDFERTYQTDLCRESSQIREKHPSIELSDEEFLRKYQLIYRPYDQNEINPCLKEKYELAEKIAENTLTIESKEINAKNKSKRTKKKSPPDDRKTQ